MRNATDQMIEVLKEDLVSVKPLPKVAQRFFLWFLVSSVSVFIGVLWVGPRFDVTVQLQNPRFLAEAITILVLSILSGVSALVYSVPETRIHSLYKRLPVFTLGVWVLVLGAAVLRLLFIQGSWAVMPGWMCARTIFLMGIVPASFLFWMVKQAAPTHLGWSGSLCALAGASFAAFGVQFCCLAGEPIHVLLWHVLPVALLTVLGLRVGRTFLRW